MGRWAARRLAMAAAGAALALALAGCDLSSTAVAEANETGAVSTAAATGAAGGDDGAATSGGPAAEGTALAALDKLTVKAFNNSKDYDRDAFGTPWKDVDHNGCDTRNDVLQRDLTSVKLKSGDDCIVQSGKLKDPYTGKVITFDRTKNASAIQIDHIVPLSDAWHTGAYKWTDEQRTALANDPEELIASDGPTNISKSDKDASEWLPLDAGFRCEYVARQIGVKTRYKLWVTKAEAAAMRDVLSTCPAQPVLGA